MEDISDPCCTEYTVSEQDMDEKLSCSICLNEYCFECNVTRLSCSHIFHYSCISFWMRDQNTCPLCRRVVFPESCRINIAFETEDTPSQSDSDVDVEMMEIEEVSDIEGDHYQIIIWDVSEDEESSDQEMDDSISIFYEVSDDRAEYEENYLASDDGNVEE